MSHAPLTGGWAIKADNLSERPRLVADDVAEGDTLLLLIQQHNQKEEHILYPMCENALAAEWTEIHERLASYPPIE